MHDEPSRIDGYKTIGFHRLLGGFYYNVLLILVGAIVFILIIPIVLPIYMPYPEIEGYSRIVYSLLGFTFGLFDFGSTHGSAVNSNTKINDGLIRFLGENVKKKPYLAMKYVQFFAWFQMFTGAIQITLISLVVLWWFPATELAHLSWFILCYILVQYPGFTQIFDSIFKGFQRLDALNAYNFLKGNLLTPLLQIAFVLLGRMLGASIPSLGELMGATIGWISSLWLIEISSFCYGGITFRSKIGKETSLSIIDVFRHDFDRKIAKDLLTFSGKLWFQYLASQFIEMLSSIIIILMIPSYGTFVGLISIAGRFSGAVGMVGSMMTNVTSPFSEAYLNGKKELFQYYTASLMKYFGLVCSYMLPTAMIFFPVMMGEFVKLIPGLGAYEPVVEMLPLILLTEAIYGPMISFSGRLLPSVDKPMKNVILALISNPFSIIFLVLFSLLGFSWQAILFSRFFAYMLEALLKYIYFNARVLKLPFGKKGVVMQAYVVPILTVLATLPLLLAMNEFLIKPFITMGLVPALVVTLLIVLFCFFIYPIFVFTPVYTFLGGFDANTVAVFDKAIPLAGPSKFIMKGMRVMIKAGARFSPLHDRFPLPHYEKAELQRQELDLLGKT
ncbi:MAG: hypothetical protein ACFFCS_11000 [Candidatus Hodarchaeota archaeon]